MTTRQQTLLEDLGDALAEVLNLAEALSLVTVRGRSDEVRRLRRVKHAAEALTACAGAAAHWTEDEREGLMYLRQALYGTEEP